MFTNNDDRDQFLGIYDVLQRSKLNIPSSICKEIAEYSTGEIVTCYFCDEDMCHLHEDEIGIDIFEFRYNDADNFYCKPCFDEQRHCGDCEKPFI